MSAPPLSQEEAVDQTSSALSPSSPAAYVFDESTEGMGERPRRLRGDETKELQALVSRLAFREDIEYPKSAHRVIGFDIKAESPDYGLGVRASQEGPPAEPQREMTTRPSPDALPKAVRAPVTTSVSPLLAAGVGALVSAGLVLVALAATGGSAPSTMLALAVLFLGAVALAGMWTLRRPKGFRELSRDDSLSMWGLRIGASLREAVSVSLRTGGLGLLVRPTGPSLESSEDTDPAGRRRAAGRRLLEAPDMDVPEPAELKDELDALRSAEE